VKIQIAVLAAAGVLLAATGCDPAATSADPNLSTPASEGAGAGTSKASKPKDDGLLDVTYKISGDAARGMITYSTPSGQEQTTRALPWQKTMRFKKGGGGFLSVSVQNKGESGAVICSIVVDGETVKKARSTGAYAIASCDHSLGF
jgi:hypothetical protein